MSDRARLFGLMLQPPALWAIPLYIGFTAFIVVAALLDKKKPPKERRNEAIFLACGCGMVAALGVFFLWNGVGLN